MDEDSILVWVACFFFLLLLNVATNNQIKGRKIQSIWVMNQQKGWDLVFSAISGELLTTP